MLQAIHHAAEVDPNLDLQKLHPATERLQDRRDQSVQSSLDHDNLLSGQYHSPFFPQYRYLGFFALKYLRCSVFHGQTMHTRCWLLLIAKLGVLQMCGWIMRLGRV